MSRQPLKVRCTHSTRKGEPCRGWAVRGTDPPTCASHLRAGPAGGALEQACSSHLHAAGADDAPVQAAPRVWLGAQGRALAAARPPETARGTEPGFYGPTLSAEELADLVLYAADLTLADEIACTRVAVRRTLEFLDQGRGSLSESAYLRAAGLVFQGARTIARLLRDQQALVGDSGDRLTAIFDAALDGLSAEWGIEL